MRRETGRASDNKTAANLQRKLWVREERGNSGTKEFDMAPYLPWLPKEERRAIQYFRRI